MRGTLTIRVIGRHLKRGREKLNCDTDLWRDLHRLLAPGGTAESRRCLVTQTVLAFGVVLGLKDMLVFRLCLPPTRLKLSASFLGS